MEKYKNEGFLAEIRGWAELEKCSEYLKPVPAFEIWWLYLTRFDCKEMQYRMDHPTCPGGNTPHP